MKKKNTPIRAMHIAFHNCKQFVFLEKIKRKALKAKDLFGFGKSVFCLGIHLRNWLNIGILNS